jgi:nitrogen fixation protein NifB
MYLKKVMEQKKNISVVGIAGPGDPFANPVETMETLRLIREEFPDLLLCLATNGLNLLPYIEKLSSYNVSHVTITINGINKEMIKKVYSWVRYGKRVRRGDEAAEILLENQLASVKKLKEFGMTVKINSILLPGINDEHIPEIAEKMAEMGVDIFNIIPYYKNPGTVFENLDAPPPGMVKKVKSESKKYLPQMSHCARCRADDVGLIGERTGMEFLEQLRSCSRAKPVEEKMDIPTEEKPFIACTTREGVLINQHLGEAEKLWIYGKENGDIKLVDVRDTPQAGTGNNRWEKICDVLSDCSYLLVNGIGGNPRKVFDNRGLKYRVVEGLVENVIGSIYNKENINHLIKRKMARCGESCSGSAMGCG